MKDDSSSARNAVFFKMNKIGCFVRSLLPGLCRRLSVVTWLALVFLLIGQTGRFFWFADLFSHFVPYYVLAFVAGCCVARSLRMRCFWAVCTSVGMVWTLTPLPCFSGSMPLSEHQNTVRLVSYNVLFSNDDKAAEANRITGISGDVFFLTEVTPAWKNALNIWGSGMVSCAEYNDSPYGVALYSKVPLRSCAVLYAGADLPYPYVRAETESGLVIYGIHPPPPLGAVLARDRDNMLSFLAGKIKAEKAPVVVAGDMNLTPFSPVMRHFLQDAGLQLTGVRGKPTWRPGYLSLDHVLTARSIAVVDAGTYPFLHSDHRPVWALIRFAGKPSKTDIR